MKYWYFWAQSHVFITKSIFLDLTNSKVRASPSGVGSDPPSFWNHQLNIQKHDLLKKTEILHAALETHHVSPPPARPPPRLASPPPPPRLRLASSPLPLLRRISRISPVSAAAILWYHRPGKVININPVWHPSSLRLDVPIISFIWHLLHRVYYVV